MGLVLSFVSGDFHFDFDRDVSTAHRRSSSGESGFIFHDFYFIQIFQVVAYDGVDCTYFL